MLHFSNLILVRLSNKMRAHFSNGRLMNQFELDCRAYLISRHLRNNTTCRSIARTTSMRDRSMVDCHVKHN
jgi:hypothetical protein